ncbi:hypothetical protein GOP47_0022141 [Adiantum capillus-veneris]|uniref:Uncharacterized protein n=1 Tax=Adiantum capillus-veneris TaxID=13818 RepID=A0A9D4Z6U5_ADICA|nr:hypothetical protein GOP47_0022141 [Adiantum capillus-veneris]
MELEAEAVVCRSDLSMQGVGQPRLDGHVEVCFEVLEFVCSRAELAPTEDSMETDTGAAYEREAPCKEEGDTNLAGDQVTSPGQVSLCQWQGFFEEDYNTESSLTCDMIAAYGTNASDG